MKLSCEKVKSMLDVALLSPIATRDAIKELAITLRNENYSFLCVHSLHTKLAADVLQGSPVKVVSCVSFPQGCITTRMKCLETEQAVKDGAGEIDMVMHLGALMEGDFKAVEDDIKSVVKTAGNLPVKVIIETPYLSMQQKIDASRIIQNAEIGRAHV